MAGRGDSATLPNRPRPGSSALCEKSMNAAAAPIGVTLGEALRIELSPT